MEWGLRKPIVRHRMPSNDKAKVVRNYCQRSNYDVILVDPPLKNAPASLRRIRT